MQPFASLHSNVVWSRFGRVCFQPKLKRLHIDEMALQSGLLSPSAKHVSVGLMIILLGTEQTYKPAEDTPSTRQERV